MKRDRYPGTQPFSKDQKDLFFGRDDDLRQLINRISLEQVVVLYSKSGLGKSSLINAGVIPHILEEESYFPFSVRFGAFAKDNTQSPAVKTRETLEPGPGIERPPVLDKLIPGENSFWYHLKTRQLSLPGRDRFLIIFDQFEELSTYGQKEIYAFKEELSELLHEEIPKEFRDVLDTQFEGGQALLTEEELSALHRPMEVKVLIAIRSDQMSLLNDFKDFFPKILRHCYELGELDEAQATEAILEPASKTDKSFATPPFSYDDEALRKILDFLTSNGKQKIDSFQLQILCHSIERKVLARPTEEVTPGFVGDVESIYKNYYENQLSQIADPEDRLAARKMIEEGMIYEEEGRRLNLYEGRARTEFGVKDEVLQKLVTFHLIRPEPSLQGGFTYEISHDSLVAPILVAYRKRRKQEEQEEARRERLRVQAELEKERRRKRRNRIAAIISTACFLIALAAFFWALWQQRIADNARKEQARLYQDLLGKDSVLMINYFNTGKEFSRRGEYLQAEANLIAAKNTGAYLDSINGNTSFTDAILAAVNGQLDTIARKRAEEEKFDGLLVAVDSNLIADNYVGAMDSLYRAKAMAVATEPARIFQVRDREVRIKDNMRDQYEYNIDEAEAYIMANECGLAKDALSRIDILKDYIDDERINQDKLNTLAKVDSLVNIKCSSDD